MSDPRTIAEFNSDGEETTPEVSSDGLTMFLASNRTGEQGGFDTMSSRRPSRAGPWSTPVFHPELNSTFSDASATASDDQRILVFTSNRNGGLDLFIATRSLVTDSWGMPVPIASLNNAAEDSRAFLTSDGLSLYFSSDRAGNYDLYVSTRASTTEPFVSISPLAELNTMLDDADPWVSPDGRHLYFMRQGPATNVLMHATR
ncbi:MAG: PD40 domain-containing protein [Deltaproteobacteria bacterium]|nr:PD40 domain-containing protein [Deltaproteobacteria bacterium]